MDYSKTGQLGSQQREVDEIWHLREPKPGRVGINAVEAWRLLEEELKEKWSPHEGDPEVRVVLCDYGVDYEHPALVGSIDMERARDFDNTLDPQGLSVAEGGQIADPIDAHGTACAGLVCGNRTKRRDPAPEENDRRFIGIAAAAKLVPFRISTNFEMESLISALKAAEQAGDVILLPRFLPYDDELDRVLRDVASRVPVICAAGNDGRPPLGYPASLPEVIAVGACNDRGYRSTYSNYGGNNGGQCPDVVAPSNDVPVDDRGLIRLDREEVTLRWRERRREAVKQAKQAAKQIRRASEQIKQITEQKIEPAAKQTAEQAASLAVEQPAKQIAIQFDPSEEPALDELNALADEEGWNLDKFGELSIATTDNRGVSGYNTDPPGDYCKVTGNFGFGGTSAASSLVAGVVALMLTANPNLRGKREGKGAVIRNLLREAASLEHLWLQPGRESKRKERKRAKDNPEQAHKEFGAGLIDAAEAVKLARMWSPEGGPRTGRSA